ncbi:FG-GAP repeat domain-containing protein [Streptomyces sp. NPDC052236]|uniref:FG-GAP repeat domain-containing protein n=1 Tax=Streptomyces sp. NPDC052236 TaxID=3365686 RepID=UPI0037D1480D
MEKNVANLPGRKRGHVLSRLAVAAIAAALVGTSAGSAVADSNPVPPALKSLKSIDKGAIAEAIPGNATASAAAAAPVNSLLAADTSGKLFLYSPNGTGGLSPRVDLDASGMDLFRTAAQADHDGDGHSEGTYYWDNFGYMYYFDDNGNSSDGSGWDIYSKVLAPGNLGSTQAYDILARDEAGALWLYKGNADGTLQSRVKVGTGWNIYTELVGQGDLSGDGKADLLARDASGAMWLYKGTGDAAAPFATRSSVGTGWNTYNYLMSTGDLNADGKTDLLARDTTGALWRYQGTGNSAAPFTARVKIGSSGWNIYRLMF